MNIQVFKRNKHDMVLMEAVKRLIILLVHDPKT